MLHALSLMGTLIAGAMPQSQTAAVLLFVIAWQGQNGTITGQLRGLDGTAAPGVRVAAMVITEQGAPGGGALASLAQTDSSGRFRLENVPPGRYYIQAGLIDFPTYYPGASTLNGATSVQVTAGALVENIDFGMTRPPGVRVSGRIPINSNPRPIRVMMSGGSMGLANAPVNADGTFEFLRVTPGNYSLTTLPASGLPSLPIIVNDKDIDLGLPAGPGPKVSGVVGLGPNSPRAVNLRVLLTGSSAWAQVETFGDAAGRFEFPVVPPGTYAMRTIPGSNPISTLVVADKDIAGLLLPGLVEIQGRAVLEGTAEWPSLSSALMIEARRAGGATLATAIRPDGTFRLPLPEGEYRISIGKAPAGLSLRSIAYGEKTNLLDAPLTLNGQTAAAEMRVTFARGQ